MIAAPGYTSILCGIIRVFLIYRHDKHSFLTRMCELRGVEFDGEDATRYVSESTIT